MNSLGSQLNIFKLPGQPGVVLGEITTDNNMSKKISSSEMKSFRHETLTAHNRYRDLHGVNKLKMNDALNNAAQKWADHLAKTGKFQHSTAEDYGENLCSHYSSAGTAYSGNEVTDYWYSEIQKYDFKSKDFKKGTGHFTQVVWKGSKEFGIGKAITKDNKVIIVGQYKPAGNLLGTFHENVFPPKGGVPKQQEPEKKRQPSAGGGGGGGRGRSDSTSSSSSSDDGKEAADKSWKLKVSRSEQRAFQKEALEVHNQYRAHHHVNPLEPSKELNRKAKKWANIWQKMISSSTVQQKTLGRMLRCITQA